MVDERKAETAGGAEYHDLFSALLEGVADEDGSGVLTTEELSECSSCSLGVSLCDNC
jgi:hypothetical protein